LFCFCFRVRSLLRSRLFAFAYERVLVIASAFRAWQSLNKSRRMFIARRDAVRRGFTRSVLMLCVFEASLSQGLCVSFGLRFALCVLCDFVWFISRKGAKAQRLYVFCVYSLCFWALRFRKGCVSLSFALCFLLWWICAVSVSRRDAESQRFYPFSTYALCFEASLSQRLRVLIYASPYVFLCDLMWFISRKGAKLARVGCLLSLFGVF